MTATTQSTRAWAGSTAGRLASWAAACWSLCYAILGLYWWSGGAGFPFATIDDNHRSGSILEGSDAAVVAPVMALLGLAGAAVAVYMALAPRAMRGAWAVISFGWAMAVTLALVLPDYSLLAFVAFAPLLVVFAFTGVPGPQDGVGDIMYWHRDNLLILFAGGLLWAWATVAYRRRLRGACPRCGGVEGHGGPNRAHLLRWGRRAVLVAALAPVPYEITRIAWFLGIPLGIPRDFLTMMQHTPGMLEVGLGCALASIGGGILTHGLVSRWGEVFPSWVVGLAGRRVPPMLAVVPATVVAVVLVPAGFMNLRSPVTTGTWAVTAPGILWIPWGAALGAAALAYRLRRQAPCRRCRRGVFEAGRVQRPVAPTAVNSRSMAGVDDDWAAEIEVRAVTGGPPPRDHVPDVIEVGSALAASQRRRLAVVGLVCVALVAGLMVGYLVGTQRAQRKTTATVPTGVAPTPLSLVSAGTQPPTPTFKRCAVQLGNQLQLGVELVNQSSIGTTLMQADVNLPLGGLRVAGFAWGSCGQLAAVDDADPHALPSGATAWLRMTFDVLVPCPGPLPVLFTVTYAQAGKLAISNVGGFSDLGEVPYTGCSASPG